MPTFWFNLGRGFPRISPCICTHFAAKTETIWNYNIYNRAPFHGEYHVASVADLEVLEKHLTSMELAAEADQLGPWQKITVLPALGWSLLDLSLDTVLPMCHRGISQVEAHFKAGGWQTHAWDSGVDESEVWV